MTDGITRPVTLGTPTERLASAALVLIVTPIAVSAGIAAAEPGCLDSRTEPAGRCDGRSVVGTWPKGETDMADVPIQIVVAAFHSMDGASHALQSLKRAKAAGLISIDKVAV